MKNMIEKLLDNILHDRIISRTVDKLLSFAPKGFRKYSKEISKFIYAALVGCFQRVV